MKKQLILCLIAGLLSAPLAYAVKHKKTASNEICKRDSDTKIALEGLFKTKGGVRSGSDDVTAEKSGDAILITFHTNVGNVAVRVVDDMGEECYYRVVNSAQQPTLHISTLGLAKGFYTLTMDNGNGVMWGEVEI